MYQKPQLGLSQAQAAMNAILEVTLQDPAHPVAIAIVDDRGSLVAFTRMDNCPPLPLSLAVKKAYTAAVVGVDTHTWRDRLKGYDLRTEELQDPNLVAYQGGLVILQPGTGVVLGGIGISGLSNAREDDDLARIGLAAMDL